MSTVPSLRTSTAALLRRPGARTHIVTARMSCFVALTEVDPLWSAACFPSGQILRQEEASRHLPHITLSREALLERHRQLGLAAPLTAPGSAPHAAARRLWMRFRWGGR